MVHQTKKGNLLIETNFNASNEYTALTKSLLNIALITISKPDVTPPVLKDVSNLLRLTHSLIPHPVQGCLMFGGIEPIDTSHY